MDYYEDRQTQVMYENMERRAEFYERAEAHGYFRCAPYTDEPPPLAGWDSGMLGYCICGVTYDLFDEQACRIHGKFTLDNAGKLVRCEIIRLNRNRGAG